jgi:REP element-mobilizing transposase RayT
MPERDIEFVQGGYYHIYNRGAGHQAIFREDENYLFVLRKVKTYARELNVAVLAYGLLPNHYHFLLRQDGAQPAGLLPQWVFNSYTKAFNKRYDRTGTLFEGRYKAIPVLKEEYLLHLCRYIHANPVRHGLASQLEEWPYSNYAEWMGLREGTLVDRAFVRAHFPTVAEYGKFVWAYALGQAELPAELLAYLRTLES